VRVALMVTCVVDVLAPDVGMAAARVLGAAGCEVDVPEGQTCCGQPAWNAGFVDEAAKVARTTLTALETALDFKSTPGEQLAGCDSKTRSEGPAADVVVCPAGSCTAMIRVFWPELFEVVGDDEAAARARMVGARVRELSEFLAARDLPPMALPKERNVVYHHSCHMLRELRLHKPPLELLGRASGCTLAEWPAAERCCGFGGLFSVKLPEVSVAMADDKLSAIPAGVDTIVGADSSCLVHLRGRAERQGVPVRTAHLAEVLAEGL
jgi:L-lactate dehydrogenase complex protein LldE